MKSILLFLISGLILCSGLQAQTFQWAKQLGGAREQNSKSVVVDAAGNVYTTGYFYDTTDFDPGVGVFQLTSTPSFGAVFVSKLNAAGNFVWAQKIETTSQSWGLAIDLDDDNNVYATGFFNGTGDFDPGAGTSNLTATGPGNIFILKLDSAGNFGWAKHFPTLGLSSNTSGGVAIKIDPIGNIYTTGYFVDTVDFDPGSGTFPLISAGYRDIFVSKLDASGNFVWAKSMGSAASDEAYAMDVDDLGNVYTTGGFNDTVDFDPSAATFELISSGTEIFVSKLDAAGSFVWAKHFAGGLGDYYGQGITVDANQNVYTTGYLNGGVDMDPGVGTAYLGSAIGEIFVSKLNVSGDYVWAITLPTSGFAFGNAMATDALGNIYIAGSFLGDGDFNPGAGVQTFTSNGNMDVFILNLDPTGGFLNAWQMGGSSTDRGESVFVDATGNIYTTGSFISSVDFDPGAGTLNLTSAGSIDVFVQKIGSPLTHTEEAGAFAAAKLSLFPNPATESLNLYTEESIETVTIYNLLGNIVQVEKESHFSVSQLPRGVYTVRIQTGSGMLLGRFVKR